MLADTVDMGWTDLKVVTVLVTCFLFAGCATLPANFGSPQRNSTIGLILLIDDHPKHIHRGTTIFQQIDNPEGSATNYREKFLDESIQVLSRRNYQIKVLEPTPLLIDERSSLYEITERFKKDVKVE